MAERSRAWAFITSGVVQLFLLRFAYLLSCLLQPQESLGTIVALAGCPFLYHYLGWQSIFWVRVGVGKSKVCCLELEVIFRVSCLVDLKECYALYVHLIGDDDTRSAVSWGSFGSHCSVC